MAIDQSTSRAVTFDLQIVVDPTARERNQKEAVAYARQVREAMQREFDKLELVPNRGGANGGGNGYPNVNGRGGNGSGPNVTGYPNGTPTGPRFQIPGNPPMPPATPPTSPSIPPTPPGPRLPIGPIAPGGAGAAATVAGSTGAGLVGAGAAAFLGVAAAGYSTYDTFFGNQNIARSGYGRMMGSAWTGSREWMADVGNSVAGWLSSDGKSEYFDPYGERKSNRMEQEILAKRERTKELEAYEKQRRGINTSRGFALFDATSRQTTDNFTRRDWAKGFVYDQQDFATSMLARNAELNGNPNDRRAVLNAQLTDLGDRNRGTFGGRMNAAVTNYNEFMGSTYRTAMGSGDPQAVVQAREREKQLAQEVKSIKLEQLRMELTSLEKIRQSREQEAQAIKEAGMTAKERFGNLPAEERQRIMQNAERFAAGEQLEIEEEQELRQFGGRAINNEAKRRSFQRADESGFDNSVLGRGFAEDEAAARKDAAIVKAQIDGKRQIQVDVSINKPEAIGEAVAKSLDDKIGKLLESINALFNERMDQVVENNNTKQGIKARAKEASIALPNFGF